VTLPPPPPSLRAVADNAKARGAWDVQPRWAAGGWFIPIGWYWVGFNQLKLVANHVGANSRPVTNWQRLFALQIVISVIMRNAGQTRVGDDVAEMTQTLRNQWVIGVITVIWFVAITVIASKAAKELDRRSSANT
jgi:hypothetical protein